MERDTRICFRWLVLFGSVCVFFGGHCGGGSGGPPAGGGDLGDVLADKAGSGREVGVEVLDGEVAPADARADRVGWYEDSSDVEGGEVGIQDTEALRQAPYIEVSELMAERAEATCETCFVIAHDAWDGSWEPEGPSQGTYEMSQDGMVFYFRPWMRFRMPHPGTVKGIYVYTAGGGGEIEIQISTGFPGGHYPCLDENTGEDLYPVGKPYRMKVSDTPGWRFFDVSALGHKLLGYDEFFVIFRQVGEARVALSIPAPREPGDYETYGGLIAEVPGDGLQCFPTMTNFVGVNDLPLVWLMRAEIVASEVLTTHMFEDLGAEGPQVGGHVSFGDFDGDGDDDFLSGGSLWKNDGVGGFTNVTDEAGLAGVGGECVWGDYDNDGWRDILCVGGASFLMHNEGDGTFVDVTADSGIVMEANNQGVAWLDADGDGYLDFYAATYGKLEDSEQAFRDFFFRNNGDGTFVDMTKEYGIPVKPVYYHGRGVCAADFDGDGDQDIYVGNYRLDPNQLWMNKGGTKGFENVAKQAGVEGAFDGGFGSSWGHTIGPSWGDLNGDGLFDLVVPNLAHPRFFDFSDPTYLYFNKGDGTFDGYIPPSKGVLYDETHSDSTLFDFDNDGDLDLFLTSVYEGRRSYLYSNDSSGSFTDVTYQAGIKHFNGWGAAASDVDGDGDLDLIANRLFRNIQGASNHFLQVKLVGGATTEETAGWSNRDAIGSVVKVETGGKILLRQVEGGKGVGCQNSALLHFGLGSASKADKLTVFWPSGKVTEMTDVPHDQVLEINERE